MFSMQICNNLNNRMLMKRLLFTPDQLKALGFVFNYQHPMEDGGHYKVYDLNIQESEISITYEFNEDGSFLSGYVEFNGTILKGREITFKDVELLKELM